MGCDFLECKQCKIQSTSLSTKIVQPMDLRWGYSSKPEVALLPRILFLSKQKEHFVGSAGYLGGWKNLGRFILNLFSVFRETDTLWRCGWDTDLEKAGAITTCLYACVNSGTGPLCSCE